MQFITAVFTSPLLQKTSSMLSCKLLRQNCNSMSPFPQEKQRHCTMSIQTDVENKKPPPAPTPDILIIIQYFKIPKTSKVPSYRPLLKMSSFSCLNWLTSWSSEAVLMFDMLAHGQYDRFLRKLSHTDTTLIWRSIPLSSNACVSDVVYTKPINIYASKKPLWMQRYTFGLRPETLEIWWHNSPQSNQTWPYLWDQVCKSHLCTEDSETPDWQHQRQSKDYPKTLVLTWNQWCFTPWCLKQPPLCWLWLIHHIGYQGYPSPRWTVTICWQQQL